MIARYGSLAVFLLLVIAASAISGMFNAGEWYYVKLHRPAWWPPEWLFGLTWALVYLAMALGAWNVWLSGHFSRVGALIWWGFLLLLNIIWSFLFFGIHRIGWSWLELGITLLIGLLCFRAFRLISHKAAKLMMPYLAWILILWALNAVVWTKNGGFFKPLFYQ
jgi:tryptophan-rich sensory protein